MKENTVPKAHYIISGRGPRNYKHAGNVKFRKLIEDFFPLYDSSSKAEKGVVIDKMMNVIHSEGMKFMVFKEMEWKQMSKTESRKKVAHVFRDRFKNSKKTLAGKERKETLSKTQKQRNSSVSSGIIPLDKNYYRHPPSSGKRPPTLIGKTLIEDIMPLGRLPSPRTNSTRPSALTLAGRGCTAEILAPIGDVLILTPISSRPSAIRTEDRISTAEYFYLVN